MDMSTEHKHWEQAYDCWNQECLEEWNEQHQPPGTPARTHTSQDGETDSWLVVEIDESGDAYPHGIGGTGHVRRAVTPWADSPHYMA